MKELVKQVLAEPYFDISYSQEAQRVLDIKAPLHVNYEEKNSLLYVCTGENATGKSFFVNILRHFATKKGIRLFHAGMVHRGAAYASSFSEHYWSLPPEEISSTGENSTALVIQGLEGAKDIEEPHILLFDEPTLGVSNSYHNAFGEYIRSFFEEKSEQLRGLLVVEHSSSCLQPLTSLGPSHLRFGDDKTLEEVIDSNTIYSLEELKQLPSRSEETRKRILAVRDKIKNYKREE